MVDATRALLDELMGRERNVPLEKRSGRAMRYSDPEICKLALAGLCPYGLFKNTKSDLGVCKYEIHEEDLQFEAVKGEYDALSQKERDRAGYEKELFALLVQLVRDMDRKIERQKERAQRESEPRPLSPAEQAQLDAVKGKEKEALDKSERLAEEGDVDGSMLFANQAEAFQRQARDLHASFTQPERTMTVCEVCGVFINSTDSEQRRKVDDHLTGKQYLGWLAIREKLGEMQRADAERGYSKAAEARPAKDARPSERDRDRDRERNRERDRERDRDRDRDRERDRGHSGRGSERDQREREREREFSRRRSRSPLRKTGSEVAPPGDLYRSGGTGSKHTRERERDRQYDDRPRR